MGAYDGAARRRIHLATVLLVPPSGHRPDRRQARHAGIHPIGLHLTLSLWTPPRHGPARSWQIQIQPSDLDMKESDGRDFRQADVKHKKQNTIVHNEYLASIPWFKRKIYIMRLGGILTRPFCDPPSVRPVSIWCPAVLRAAPPSEIAGKASGERVERSGRSPPPCSAERCLTSVRTFRALAPPPADRQTSVSTLFPQT